ncbi:hypothetical protein [Fibrella arboris]|uniref:hypothetical protein n=1 Tax=Fibrella arboris TaxID=3242486 RepID=UPI003522F0A2
MTSLLVSGIVGVSYFILNASPTTSLLPSSIRQCRSCQAAQTLAADDFKAANYQVIQWGLPDRDSPAFIQAELLQRTYGIKTIFGGCVGPPIAECYDQHMRKLLSAKYGATIYQEARNKALKQAGY